ncbi:MAG TPA: hypothetical protein VNE39_04975 [Planctomycetota bacterium]|nr:hypothetical protein [Planctomycetota bacterium]
MATPKGPAIRRRMPPRRKAKPIWEVIDEIMADVPEEELAKLPRDGAAEHDHYIYGTPKRGT